MCCYTCMVSMVVYLLGIYKKKCFSNKITFVIYVRVPCSFVVFIFISDLICIWLNFGELMKLIFYIAAFHKKWPIVLRLLMWYKAIPMATYIYSNNTIHHPNKLSINIQHAIKFIPVISNLCRVCTKRVPFEMVRMWWNGIEHKQGELMRSFIHLGIFPILSRTFFFYFEKHILTRMNQLINFI